MKKLYTLLAATALSFGAMAQGANLGFEGTFTALIPGFVSQAQYWSIGTYVERVGNTTAGAGGKAVQLSPVNDPQVLAAFDETETIPGFISQTFDLVGVPGLDYSTTSVNVDVIWEPQGGDTAYYHVQFLKSVPDQPMNNWIHVGTKMGISIAGIASWTTISLPQFSAGNAPAGTIPDKMIIFASTNFDAEPTMGTKLSLDNWKISVSGYNLATDNVSAVLTSIFPNPATDFVNVAIEGDEVASVNVLSLDGKVVSTQTSSKVDVSGLTSGVYFLNITTASGKTTIEKVTVK